MVDANMDPLAFLKNEVSNGDQHVRVHAMERLRYAAFALGDTDSKRSERVHGELVPYLLELCENRVVHGNDELRHKIGLNLCSLAAMLEKDKLSCLLPICHILCEEEEFIVREQGLNALVFLGELNPALGAEMYPNLKKLVAAEWFTSRLSAISWMPDLYTKVGDTEQKEIIQMYQAMCNDEAPMVRRLAAVQFDKLFQSMTKESILNPVAGNETAFLQTFLSLATDSSQDSIRRSCVDAAVVLAGMLSPDENRQHVLHLLQSAAEDKSWRVRLKLAQKFALICQKLQPDQTSQFILTSFGNLLRDTEQEVRIAATVAIGDAVGYLPADQLQSIVPHLQGLAMDTCQAVRSALGKTMGPLCTKLGRDLTTKVLLPIVLDLFKDEFHEARLSIVQQTGQICEVLGMDAVTASNSLINALQVLIMDNQWRIRLAVVEQIASLAKQFGVDMFQTKLESVFLSSIDDSVFFVRMQAVDVLRKVAKHFGATWTVDHLLPKILEHYNANSGFVMRVTVLNTMHRLAEVLNPDQIMEHLFPVVLRGANDSVPNVRCQALQTLNNWIRNPDIGLTPEVLARNLRQELPRLQQDTDQDVQVQVYQTMKLIEAA
jgi:serine/threonine-protein phosphatase 2A regulatory subunit A